MKRDNFVTVYTGRAFNANVVLARLKDSGIQSAVKIDNSVSSYIMLSKEDEIIVHKKEAEAALKILNENPETE